MGVNWLKDVLFHAHFTVERVKTVATKWVNEVPTAKRSGKRVTGEGAGIVNLKYVNGVSAVVAMKFGTTVLPQQITVRKVSQLQDSS